MRRRRNRFNTHKFIIKKKLSHGVWGAVAYYFKTTTCRVLEAVLGGQRNDAGGALQPGAGLARGVVHDLARFRLESVIGKANAEVRVDAPAGAAAGIPAAAVRSSPGGAADWLAHAV